METFSWIISTYAIVFSIALLGIFIYSFREWLEMPDLWYWLIEAPYEWGYRLGARLGRWLLGG